MNDKYRLKKQVRVMITVQPLQLVFHFIHKINKDSCNHLGPLNPLWEIPAAILSALPLFHKTQVSSVRSTSRGSGWTLMITSDGRVNQNASWFVSPLAPNKLRKRWHIVSIPIRPVSPRMITPLPWTYFKGTQQVSYKGRVPPIGWIHVPFVTWTPAL